MRSRSQGKSIAFASPPLCRVVTSLERRVAMKEAERTSDISFNRPLHGSANKSGGLSRPAAAPDR